MRDFLNPAGHLKDQGGNPWTWNPFEDGLNAGSALTCSVHMSTHTPKPHASDTSADSQQTFLKFEGMQNMCKAHETLQKAFTLVASRSAHICFQEHAKLLFSVWCGLKHAHLGI